MSQIHRIAKLIDQASHAVAFTGAGISTESGIPDFRSPGGIWSQSTPVLYDDFMASETARYEYWRQKSVSHRDFQGSQPNTGHQMLAKWERQGRLDGVITQNIDGLHQDAGSQLVVELHGTARFIACQDCGSRYEADAMVEKFLTEDAVPPCAECAGRLKHATISFGQSLDEEVLTAAVQLTARCDLFIAMGSSLVVDPAARLPVAAATNGAALVIINRDPTDKDELAEVVVNDGIGATLSAIDELL